MNLEARRTFIQNFLHVSCRNLDKPGWALISTQAPDSKYPNHDFEIFWVRMNGSGEVRRVAHHRSSREEGGVTLPSSMQYQTALVQK